MLAVIEQAVFESRLATVVVPVAAYFLVLGLLNSRRHPQLLSGLLDLGLLLGALSPLILLPAISILGWPLSAAMACLAALTIFAHRRTQTGGNWVIYNISPDDALLAVGQSLEALDAKPSRTDGGYSLPDGTLVELGGFELLHNVSVRMHGANKTFCREFSAELWRRLARREAQTSAMAMSLLLVATAMLVAPLALLANRMPEMVRVLTDLLQ